MILADTIMEGDRWGFRLARGSAIPVPGGRFVSRPNSATITTLMDAGEIARGAL